MWTLVYIALICAGVSVVLFLLMIAGAQELDPMEDTDEEF